MSFETLFCVQHTVAVEAGYRAIRALKHRCEAVIIADTPFGVDSVKARNLAERLIQEIAATERKSVPDFDRATVDYYISKIAGIVQTRMRGVIAVNAERGNALLAELRTSDIRR